jgi:ankyrin repeat protein
MNLTALRKCVLGSGFSLIVIAATFAQATPRQASRDKPSPSPAAKKAAASLDKDTDKALKELDFARACENGDVAKAKDFLAKDGDPNTRDALKNPVLVNAVLKNRTEIVRLLLEAKADPNILAASVKVPPLMFAAEKGNLEIISLLLKAGANVSFRSKTDDPKMAANNGLTPLIASISPGISPEVVHTLVRAGADVNAKADNGLTALLKAALEGSVDTVKALIEEKADTNAKANPPNDITPVMAAVAASVKIPGRGEVIKLLAEAGADLNAKTSAGLTATKLAHAKADPVIQKAVKDAGGTE